MGRGNQLSSKTSADVARKKGICVLTVTTGVIRNKIPASP